MKKVIITGNSFEIKGSNEDKIFTPIMSNFETDTQLMYDKEKNILSIILNKSMCMNLNIKNLTLREICTKLHKAGIYTIHEINVTWDSEIRIATEDNRLSFIDDDRNCKIVVTMKDYNVLSEDNNWFQFFMNNDHIRIENSKDYIKIRINMSDLKKTLDFLDIPFIINLNIERDQ